MKKLLEEMEQAKAVNDKLVSALREHLKSLFDEVALQYKASFDRFVARALHLCPNDDLSELGMFMVVKDGQLVEEELEDEAEGLESGSNVAIAASVHGTVEVEHQELRPQGMALRINVAYLYITCHVMGLNFCTSSLEFEPFVLY